MRTLTTPRLPTFAYNSSFHRQIQDTPFFLAYGRDPRHPLNTIDVIDLEKMLGQAPNQRSTYFQQLYKAQNHAVALQEEIARPSGTPEEWPIGTSVWLYTPPTSSKGQYAKFKRPWSGPCRITATRAHNSRDITDQNGRRLFDIHTSRLKKFFTPIGPIPPPTEAPPVNPA